MCFSCALPYCASFSNLKIVLCSSTVAQWSTLQLTTITIKVIVQFGLCYVLCGVSMFCTGLCEFSLHGYSGFLSQSNDVHMTWSSLATLNQLIGRQRAEDAHLLRFDFWVHQERGFWEIQLQAECGNTSLSCLWRTWNTRHRNGWTEKGQRKGKEHKTESITFVVQLTH